MRPKDITEIWESVGRKEGRGAGLKAGAPVMFRGEDAPAAGKSHGCAGKHPAMLLSGRKKSNSCRWGRNAIGFYHTVPCVSSRKIMANAAEDLKYRGRTEVSQVTRNSSDDLKYPTGRRTGAGAFCRQAERKTDYMASVRIRRHTSCVTAPRSPSASRPWFFRFRITVSMHALSVTP